MIMRRSRMFDCGKGCVVRSVIQQKCGLCQKAREIEAMGYELHCMDDDSVAKIEPLAAEFFDEANRPGVWDKVAFTKGWGDMLWQGFGFMFGVWDGETYQAMVAGTIGPDLYTSETIATEAIWYVRPDERHRSPRLGPLLLDLFEESAKAKGCHRIYMAHLVELNGVAMGRFLRGRGYAPLDVAYEKGI